MKAFIPKRKWINSASYKKNKSKTKERGERDKEEKETN